MLTLCTPRSEHDISRLRSIVINMYVAEFLAVLSQIVAWLIVFSRFGS